MGNDFTTAAELYAGTATGGPITADFHVFATLYTALFTPFEAGVAGVLGALLPWMLAAVTAGLGVSLVLWALTIAIGIEGGGAIFNRMITKVLLPAAVVVFLLSSVGNYQHWIVTWVAQIPDDIGRVITGGIGGAAVNSGDPFDNVWNKAFIAGAKVFQALPISFKGAVLAIVVIGYWGCAAAASVIAFGMFLASRVLFELLIAVSPVFIGVGAFQQSRFLLKGFVSAVASVIVAQILTLALLGIVFNVENATLAPIVAAPDNANIPSMIVSLIITAIVMFECAVQAIKIPAIAVGIAGGVFDGMAAWVAAGGGAVSAAASAASGMASLSPIGSTAAANSAAPRVAAAGRSLSGRP